MPLPCPLMGTNPPYNTKFSSLNYACSNCEAPVNFSGCEKENMAI